MQTAPVDHSRDYRRADYQRDVESSGARCTDDAVTFLTCGNDSARYSDRKVAGAAIGNQRQPPPGPGDALPRAEGEQERQALRWNQKLNTFLGTSPAALRTRVWTALIAMLIAPFAQWTAQWGRSTPDPVAWLSVNLPTPQDMLSSRNICPAGVCDPPEPQAGIVVFRLESIGDLDPCTSAKKTR